ncbi:MAG: cytochrome b N-terminal domain-containing protein [Planctomycetes bacterium]|nr:cytochrome b N-terminal domain-containing protein [Planctomycetota bacterium]
MNGFKTFLQNLRELPQTVRYSLIRHGTPSSDRARSQAVFSNFFLHIQATRVHKHTLKFATTLGLGIIAMAMFLILCISGVLLMVYYKPATDQAYDSLKDIIFVVPTGRMMRNIHRWAAHGMVLVVLLHMARVFFTGSYKGPRQFNWALGMVLLILTLALSFTGYLLPWDQLAYWAITIGANIAQSPREITDALGITEQFDPGGMQKTLLLGASSVGQEALIRFYVLHVAVLPVALLLALGVHFWRIRKDGGLARPDDVNEKLGADRREHGREIFPALQQADAKPTRTYGLMAMVRGKSPAVDRGPEHTVPAWPNLFYAEMAVAMFSTAVIVALAYFLDAPLKERANPSVPENPAKAPWYFLGLQEMVSYSAFMGGVGIPSIVVIGLGLIPYLDREERPNDVGVWFGGPEGRKVCLLSLLFSVLSCVAILAFTVKYGWLRNWIPSISQLWITAFNPGTLFVGLYAAWSLLILKRTNSTRMAALALFTCFIVSFFILTYFATFLRGPNWDFYWSQSDWPVH